MSKIDTKPVHQYIAEMMKDLKGLIELYTGNRKEVATVEGNAMLSREYSRMEEDAIKRLDTAAMKRELWIAVDKLPPNQTQVIRERYANRKTLQEVGEVLGLSIGTVRQAEEKAIRTLKIPSRCRTFKAYYEEYLSAAPVHHVGVERFNRTWTSEVEQAALKRIEREEEQDRIMREFSECAEA